MGKTVKKNVKSSAAKPKTPPRPTYGTVAPAGTGKGDPLKLPARKAMGNKTKQGKSRGK